MGKINRPKSANIIWVKPTEEKRKEILDIIGSMMMDYINRRPEKEGNNRGIRKTNNK